MNAEDSDLYQHESGKRWRSGRVRQRKKEY